MPPKDLQILVTRNADTLTVALAGEANFAFDAALENIEKILAHKPKNVILDASKLTFISSIGICFLINLRKAIKETGGSVRLEKLQPLVRKAMEHAHVIHLFDLQTDPS